MHFCPENPCVTSQQQSEQAENITTMSDNTILAALKMTGKVPSGMTAAKLHAEAADQVGRTISAARPGPRSSC